MLRLELEVKARRGDFEGATRSLRAMFLASKCLEREPIIVSQLVVSAIDNVAKYVLSQKLCLVEFPAADLQAIQHQLRNYDRARQLRNAFVGERALGHSVMRDQSLVDSTLPAKPAMPSDAAYYLQYMNRSIAAIDKPFPEALDEGYLIQSGIDQDFKGRLGFTRIVSSFLVPVTGAAIEATARNIATDRAADAGIAIEFYRRENGTLPPSLDALVPKYLPNAPIDPVNGKPMIYKVDEKGFLIYSVGKNKVDDGGRLDNKPGEDNRIRDEGLFFPLK